MTALNNIVHIALAANHRYLPGLEATLSSIIASASDRSALQFHVFSEGLYDEDKTKLANLARKFGLKRDIDFITPDMSPIAKFFKPFNLNSSFGFLIEGYEGQKSTCPALLSERRFLLVTL